MGKNRETKDNMEQSENGEEIDQENGETKRARKERKGTEKENRKAERDQKKEQKERKRKDRIEKKKAKKNLKTAQKKRKHRNPNPANEPPKRSVLEEVGNAVVHGAGSLAGMAGMYFLLRLSDTPMKVLSSLVYGLCLILLFLMSCLYHAFRWGSRVKRLWRRFDYCSIYLLIGGTFTPLWLVYWGNQLGIILCCVQWAIIITGVTLISVFGPGRVKWIHMTLYFVLGWSALIFLPGMIRNCLPLFCYILGGGIIYTLGIIPFAKKAKGAHFIWHFFVLFGAVAHWIGIYLYVYGAAAL